MHNAAKQDGGENPQQGAGHEQPFRTIAGIGPSFVVRVATPIGVSYSRHTSTNCSTPPVGSQLPGRASGATVIVNRPSMSRTISSLVKPWRSIVLATSRPSGSYNATVQ